MINACDLCRNKLPFEPRPIFQFTKESTILLVGQAPGIKAHDSGIPWNDKSGDRLREWLGVSKELFYNPSIFAIVPMAFCYPGRGNGGDLPPPKECSQTWMPRIREHLSNIKLEVYVGKHACDYRFGRLSNLTNFLKRKYKSNDREIALPHPSPRNNIWLAKNKWFEEEAVPVIREKCQSFL